MNENDYQTDEGPPILISCNINENSSRQIDDAPPGDELKEESHEVKQFDPKSKRGVNQWPNEIPRLVWDKQRPNESPRLTWGSLDDGHLFFDREKELQQLKEAFMRRIHRESTPELILISGRSGTGKTLLANQLRETVNEKNGFFVIGKFDQYQQPEPYAPLVTAMTEFVYLVLERDEEVKKQIKDGILNLLGNDIGILTMMVPALEKLVGEQQPRNLKGPDAQDRLKIIFQKFARACASPNPLVLLMDDVQWADRGSLELFEAMTCDDLNHSLVVICVCRSDEVSINHEFACLLRRLEDEKNATISNIEVGCLTLGATKLLVSSLLHQSYEFLCDHIASNLYSKTHGNVFFIIQFFKALYDSRILYLKDNCAQWSWNEAAYVSTFGHVLDVTDLLAERIRNLSVECCVVLKTSACLGIELDPFLLSKLIDESIDVDEILQICMEEGLVVFDEGTSCYRFSHDQMQQASYTLIPEPNRPLFHYSIGHLLCAILSESELDQYIFVAVDQLIRGVTYLHDEQEAVELSCLCLHAGERAMSLSDFKISIKYFDLGSSLLDSRRHWVDYYDLSLSLANARAEALCCNADFETTDEAVNSILDNARCFDDTILAYTCQIYTLGARLRLDDAIMMGLEILDRLGESFPEQRGMVSLMANLINVKRMLFRRSNKDIMGLPDITSQTKLSAMTVLNVLLTYAFIGKPDLFPFFALRMVKISLKYGLSAISSMGFCCYGLLLCGIGDFDGGNRFGELSLFLLDRYDPVKIEWTPRVFLVYYGMIAHWKFPVKSTLEPLLESRQIGIDIGDHEYSSVNSFQYFHNADPAGVPLLTLEPAMRNALGEMKAQRQVAWLELLSVQLEYTLIMMGKTEDKAVVNGVLMKLNTPSNPKMTEVMNTANLNVKCYVCMATIYRMVIAYFRGDLETALEMARKSENVAKDIPAAPIIKTHALYDGLSAFDAVRGQRLTTSLQPNSRRMLISRGKKRIKKLKSFSEHCPENSEMGLLLLEAEFAAVKGKIEEAMFKYSLAERLAERHGNMNIQALVCERAGMTLKWSGKEEERSRSLIQRSIELYEGWGAFPKANQLLALLETRGWCRSDLIV